MSGQTSVKKPEQEAFETHLPANTYIVSCHSLHGPGIDPAGQPLVCNQPSHEVFSQRIQILINHRGTSKQLAIVEQIYQSFRSKIIHLSYAEHDLITANTQAVTHAAFLSMGSAWSACQEYPWKEGRYVEGIEVVKTNLTMRIYSSKWHVYAGLAILNSDAHRQILQYAKSVQEIFRMMTNSQDHGILRERIFAARTAIFDTSASDPAKRNILHGFDLNRFSLGQADSITAMNYRKNSQLSILAMVDSWHGLQINPFHHLAIAATPLFRLWLGVAEYLFTNVDRLESALKYAAADETYREDDREFVRAAQEWSQLVSKADFTGYQQRFEKTSQFFSPSFEISGKMATQMLMAYSAKSED